MVAKTAAKSAPAPNAQVANILEAITSGASTTESSANTVSAAAASVKKPASTKKAKQPVVPRGVAKSGRPWKEVKQKFANIKKSIYRPTTEKKHAFREEMKHIKELSKSVRADRKQENEDKRARRELNAQRKQENERKSEIVQVIKNPAKIKRMKKKALRKIEKRDLSTVKTV